MPYKTFHATTVKNLTAVNQILRSADGDSVTIPPNAQNKIDKKFLTWQPPSPRNIRVLAEHPITPSKAVSRNSSAEETAN